jgi:hypothetical protein
VDVEAVVMGAAVAEAAVFGAAEAVLSCERKRLKEKEAVLLERVPLRW